ncbi:MAG: hypothetical protein KAH10_09405, partial [Flavobacteriales bacterium]|nr:hypothetical protein [Flavobacteriales bacterium]
LIRPSQVSAKYYGEKLYLNKLLKLSPTAFSEEKILELSSDLIGKNYSGIHNICISDGMWAMDVKKHRWGFNALRFKYRN